MYVCEEKDLLQGLVIVSLGCGLVRYKGFSV